MDLGTITLLCAMHHIFDMHVKSGAGQVRAITLGSLDTDLRPETNLFLSERTFLNGIDRLDANRKGA